MNTRTLTIVILAAGKGSRLGGSDQKVLRPLCGKPMVCHVVQTVRALQPTEIIVVVGFMKNAVMAALAGEGVSFVEQPTPRGTGDAVLRAADRLDGSDGDMLVMCGDVPFLTPTTLRRLIATHRSSGASCTILTAHVTSPTGYGRIVRDAHGSPVSIVEELNATPEQKEIREINTGVYLFRTERIFPVLRRVRPDPVKGEYYLTDAVGLLAADGEPIATYTTPTPEETMGINTPQELAAAETYIRREKGMNTCCLFAGNANAELSAKIAECLGKRLGTANIFRFSDGEICVKIEENVRGTDVFVIQPTCPPVNENLMELLIMLDAFRRASPRRITAVLPYYGYARQDRKDQPRVPITAKLVANLLVSAGANRILTMDLHAPQVQGFFDIPVDHLFASPVIVEHLRTLHLPDPVVVAPDVGGVKTARAFAKNLSATLAIVDKRRDAPDKVEMIHVIGEVEGKTAIIVDDLISTGNTIVQAAQILRRKGAREVYATCTHALFCDRAIEILGQSGIRKLIITDTIPQKNLPPFVERLSVAPLLAEAIKRIHLETSVSSLFL